MTHRRSALAFDEARIDAIFAKINQCQLPGAAVGIAIGGTPVYRKGFGLASMELPVVLSPSIRMRIHSTSKHFTCLAYLLLCEEGKAGIDDPIGNALPELSPVTRSATMRQLMGHISGIRDACDIRWQFSGTETLVSSHDLVALYQDIDDVNATPESGWNYNNGGYQLLSAAIERITGQSLEEVLRSRIFEPVGMHDTLLRRYDRDFVPNSATLHMRTAAGGYDRSYLGGALAGEGGIVSTVDDMLRWLAHMDRPVVGSAATWAALKTPLQISSGISTGYGLGLMLDRYRGVDTLSHSGNGLGGNSQMIKVPAAGLDAAIMVNRQDVDSRQLANQILDACIVGLDVVKESPHSEAFIEGTFRSLKSGHVIQLFAKEGKQMLAINGGELPFVPGDDGVLRPPADLSFIKQSVALLGGRLNPRGIRFDDFGNMDDLVAVEPTPNVDVATIAGCYQSKSTGTQITICRTHEGPRLITAGRFGSTKFSLESLGEGLWRAKSMTPAGWGGIVSFGDGSAGLRFTTGRTWSLPFEPIA
jgi:CubicO group peptidase (beta-lactamase class C family)